MKKNTNNFFLKVFIMAILIILTVIQQMPVIKDIYYNEIRIFLYLIFAILSFFAFGNILQNKNDKFVKNFLFTIMYTLIIIVPLSIIGGQIDFSATLELIVPFGILICSMYTTFDKKQLKCINCVYVILAVILGITSIFYYGQGFVLVDTYFLRGKNQIGPIIGISSIIILYNLFNIDEGSNGKRIVNVIFDISMFIALFSCLIIFRNRAGTLGVLITSLLMVLKRLRNKLTHKKLIFISFIILSLFVLYINGALNDLFGVVWNSFMLNGTVTDLNSISSGRTDVYENAIIYSLRNLLIGDLGNSNEFYATAHNYIINKWIKYGIIGSIPIIMFYISLWKITIVNLFRKMKVEKNNTLVFYVLFFSLIVSIFEYTYPFGPGNSQIMVWFLLGQYLKNNNYRNSK